MRERRACARPGKCIPGGIRAGLTCVRRRSGEKGAAADRRRKVRLKVCGVMPLLATPAEP